MIKKEMKFVNNCEKLLNFIHASNVKISAFWHDFHILTTPTNATKRNLKTKRSDQ